MDVTALRSDAALTHACVVRLRIGLAGLAAVMITALAYPLIAGWAA